MKKWIFPNIDPKQVAQLAAQMDIAPVWASLLLQRGITDAAAAQAFFHPAMDQLHPPQLMQDMDKAVQRLNAAIKNKENILLYGDYDVDGTTSVALMYAFLRNFYANIDYYIPNRDKEGYGISKEGVRYAQETACTLLVAMDCGIKDHEAIDLAAQNGIDCIVCDHHTPEGALPNAVAILNPKRSDCNYPFKELSGCGIAFKLAQAYALHHQIPAQELGGLLDFVALSIACDVVPMIGENRVLTHFGLEKMNRFPRLGLWALINRSGREYPLTVSDLVFGLGPIINAAGRIGDAKEAVRLMLSNNRNNALLDAGHLLERNRQRQEADNTATTAARLRAQAIVEGRNPKTLVLYEPTWHKGIVGITASRLSQDFYKPVVILTQSDGVAIGSARSVPGLDLYEAIRACAPLLHSFGGHAHAVGLQLPIEHVQPFTECLENWVQTNTPEEHLLPTVGVEEVLALEQITPQFFKEMQRFAPFGPHNMTPVFVAKSVTDTGRSHIFANNHARLELKQGNTVARVIAFGLADKFEQVRHRPFDIAFTIKEDQWKGKTNISLYLKDLH